MEPVRVLAGSGSPAVPREQLSTKQPERSVYKVSRDQCTKLARYVGRRIRSLYSTQCVRTRAARDTRRPECGRKCSEVVGGLRCKSSCCPAAISKPHKTSSISQESTGSILRRPVAAESQVEHLAKTRRAMAYRSTRPMARSRVQKSSHNQLNKQVH